MAPKCCVPGCKSNYESELKKNQPYYSVFKFPDDGELKEKWLKAIHRANWEPTKGSVVCIRHFHEADVDLHEIVKDKEGVTHKVRRHKPILSRTAVPNVFHNQPQYLTKKEELKRTHPEERRNNSASLHNKKTETWLETDLIKSFQDFVSGLKNSEHVFNEWHVSISERFVVFYVLDYGEITKIRASIYVDPMLKISVNLNGNLVLNSDLLWILPKDCKLSRWSQIENILARYKNEPTSSKMYSKDDILEKITFLDTIENSHLTEEEQKQVEFFSEQLKLSLMAKKKYSVNMIFYSFLIYEQSVSTYLVLRNNNILNLPHPKYLQNLSTKFNVSSKDNDENYSYLKSVANRLSEREKIVVVQLDEIYVSSKLMYRNGHIEGHAENNASMQAKTIQAFMISSAFGRMKEIVGLYPVKNLKSHELLELTEKVCSLLTECGFKILILISDNNRINRSMFNDLKAKNIVKTIFPNFMYMYDFVHIFKNIRNNWLNLKDAEKTFVYPDFEGNGTQCAKFQDLRDLYKKESTNLVKLGSKLNFKSVYPSNLERQNVTLVCNIFHESTIAALNELNLSEGTVFFVQLVYKWWNIVNIKSPWKSTIKRNPLQAPFNNQDDERLKFLADFVVWVKRWGQMKEGGLSKDTCEALQHSTWTVINLIKLSLTKYPDVIQYVLTGKFQTDNLERRFSSYRQLSGGNYNVSVMQVLDAEKKIRMKSYLGIKSSKYGKLKFSPAIISESIRSSSSDDTSSNIISSFIYENEIIKLYFESDDCEVSMSPIIYISGYASRKIQRDAACASCISFLCGAEVQNEYFEELNRGGLTVPSAEAVIVTKTLFIIVDIIVKNQYFEIEFLKSTNQQAVILKISMEILKIHFQNDNMLCECGKEYYQVLNKFIRTISNILLSNYTKVKNDENIDSLNKKRKLSTLR